MTKLMKWANLFLVFLTILSYLSPYVSPATFWPLSFLGLSYPWLLLANVVFCIYWGIQKNRYAFFSLFVILIGWNYLSSFIGLNFNNQSNSEKDVTVVSFNINGLKKLARKSNKDIEESYSQFLEKINDVDIICAQEASKATIDYFSKPLKLPYTLSFDKKQATTIIFSKYAFLNSGSISFKNKVNSCIWADLLINGDTLRIYNFHLQSNGISGTTEKLAKEGDLQEKETWENIKKVISRYKRAAQIRADQAKKIANHIRTSPHQVLLCGDLNDTPVSYPYYILSNDFQDSFREKGQGIGTTYAGSLPALRIDYIFADNNFEILSHQVLHENFSDHYPVVGTLRIKEK